MISAGRVCAGQRASACSTQTAGRAAVRLADAVVDRQVAQRVEEPRVVVGRRAGAPSVVG